LNGDIKRQANRSVNTAIKKLFPFSRTRSKHMKSLNGKIAWVTGAGSGIGEAAALALAKAGATVVLTGRRPEALAKVAADIAAAGGKAHAEPGDLMRADTAARIVDVIKAKFGRLDILVNNAGVNIGERSWRDLKPEGVDQLIHGNLSSAFYCVTAVLPLMRAQQDGLLIHTATKHGVVAMSHSLNMEECVNGIRSTVVCPGEVATPILDKRPVPVSAEDRAKMVQSSDVGDLILYIAQLPPHVCLNEVLITPTWNRSYVALRNQPHMKI
jgi:NADP-dependent 3-hydroxy acid dehydrogenase YdfG